MDKKLIIKIALIFILLIAICNFDYCIYMFISNNAVKLPNSIDYKEKDMFDMAKDFTNNFFYKLQSGNYEEAFDMIHENCKRDLFDSDLARFTKVIESKYFSKQLGNKYFTLKNAEIDNIDNNSSFHAYYITNVFCDSEALPKTNSYYKSRNINVDVVKKDEEFKLILTFEEDKVEENNEKNNK